MDVRRVAVTHAIQRRHASRRAYHGARVERFDLAPAREDVELHSLLDQRSAPVPDGVHVTRDKVGSVPVTLKRALATWAPSTIIGMCKRPRLCEASCGTAPETERDARNRGPATVARCAVPAARRHPFRCCHRIQP